MTLTPDIWLKKHQKHGDKLLITSEFTILYLIHNAIGQTHNSGIQTTQNPRVSLLVHRLDIQRGTSY